MNWLKRKKTIITLSLIFFLIISSTIFYIQANAETRFVIATSEYNPGFYWCQHLDGRWSTYSGLEDKNYYASNNNGEPSKTWSKTSASITPPSNKEWVDSENNRYSFSEIKNIKPISVKMKTGSDPAIQGKPYISNDRVIIEGYSGKGVNGFPSNSICGGSPGMIYPFPIEVTFQGEVEIKEPEPEIVGLRAEFDSTIQVGETVQVNSYLEYSNGDDVKVTKQSNWHSEDTNIATVDNSSNKGLVTAQSPGSVEIVATYTVTSGQQAGTTFRAASFSSDPLTEKSIAPESTQTLNVDGKEVNVAVYKEWHTTVDEYSSITLTESDFNAIPKERLKDAYLLIMVNLEEDLYESLIFNSFVSLWANEKDIDTLPIKFESSGKFITALVVPEADTKELPNDKYMGESAKEIIISLK